MWEEVLRILKAQLGILSAGSDPVSIVAMKTHFGYVQDQILVSAKATAVLLFSLVGLKPLPISLPFTSIKNQSLAVSLVIS